MARDTRSLLIAAAAALLDEGGPAAVTLREVGRRAGVSHNAPYKHFASKNDLLAAIATGELARQSATMSALGSRDRPIRVLRALMRGYVRWALGQPARFKLTFGPGTHGSQELGKAAGDARAAIIAIVEKAQAARELAPGNPERVVSLMLATAHGAADLALSGHLSAKGKGAADPEDLVDDLFALLEAQPQKKSRTKPSARRRTQAR
jgi:AcrR family transcriptional regulator